MKNLVIGGTGTVGSHVVLELLKRGEPVSALTRDPDKVKTLPDGVHGIVGDLAQPETVRRIFDGVENVFLINVVSPKEAHEGLMAVCGMRIAGVKKCVFLSVHHADRAPYLPHFGSKLPIEKAIADSGMAYTILRPNNFHQNDYWFKDAILQHGVYPQPIGEVGLSRVDVRDIAEAAAVALTTEDHNGQTYNLVGPDHCTGKWTAQIWSKVLGRDVRYGGEDMDAWEKANAQYMPETTVFDFRLMYEFFQKEGLLATPEDIERQARLLGHAPRSFEAFATELARAWTSEPVGARG